MAEQFTASIYDSSIYPSADNIMLRGATGEVVLVDLGLAHHVSSGWVHAGINPLGAQTHWSPEKAASEGYSFPSDMWATMCVLCEMITGDAPWHRRYKNARLLHFVVSMSSCPQTLHLSCIGCTKLIVCSPRYIFTDNAASLYGTVMLNVPFSYVSLVKMYLVLVYAIYTNIYIYVALLHLKLLMSFYIK